MILVDAAGLAASRPGRPLFADVVGHARLAATAWASSASTAAGSRRCCACWPASASPRPAWCGGAGARGSCVLDQDAELPPAPPSPRSSATGWEAAVGARPARAWAGGSTTRCATLSGGQAKRVALARALLDVGRPGEADDDVLLILDEPTNHLDIDGIAWLEERLAAHRGGLVLVTHDRHVLDRVTTRVLELDRGRGYVHDGGYAGYLEARAEREERAARREDERRNLARAELAWLRRGAPARTRKPQARIEAATALVEGRPGGAGAAAASSTSPSARPRLGDKVVELARRRPPLRRGSVAVPGRRAGPRPP